MARNGILVVKDGQLRKTINGLLRDLLDRKVVEAILLPVAHPAGGSVVPTLVSDASLLEKADVLAPVFPVNCARVVSVVTKFGPPDKRTAVVLKPCELRALIELVKLKQASLDNIILIGVDCFGAYPAADYRKFAAEKTSDDFVALILPSPGGRRGLQKGKEDTALRIACQICEYPAPLTSDLTIGLFGLDPRKAVLLEANTRKGEEVLPHPNPLPAGEGEAEKRAAAVSQLLTERKKKRQEFFARTREEIGGPEKLSAVFASCINCHNCRRACPICYCRECFFESPAFDLEGDRYVRMAQRKGAMRMPADTLLFQVTRMTHVDASCAGCGCCEEACPQEIPLLKLFQLTADKVQKLFEYTPGRSLEDVLPLASFKEDEFNWIGTK